MNSNIASQVKNNLLSAISEIEKQKDQYLIEPGNFFSRKRKISFLDTILFTMLSMNNSLATEIMNYFPEENMPSPSAILQRKSRLQSDAFRDLFYSFTNTSPRTEKFMGYQLVACDGTRLNLPYNPNDPKTFVQNIKNRKGINQMHMTVFYDCLNKIYLDAFMQYGNAINEHEAFCRMVDRYDYDIPTIFIADRGFCSYNDIAHVIHNQGFFLLRAPERTGWRNVIDPNVYAADFFDVDISLTFTKSRKNIWKEKPNVCVIYSNRTYDYVKPNSDESDTIDLRILKIGIGEGKKEMIVTNLPRDSFSASDIKELYNLRWGIETSFRHLKYASELVYIHSKNENLRLQEIFAKLTLFNFASAIVLYSTKNSGDKKKRKYQYLPDFTRVVKACVKYICGKLNNILQYIQHCNVPVRPGRKFERNVTRQVERTLLYR